MLISFHVQIREGGPGDKVFGKKIRSDQREVGDLFFKTLHDLFPGQSAVTILALEKRNQPPAGNAETKREAVRGMRPGLMSIFALYQKCTIGF